MFVTFSYTYVNLLVLVTISNCSMHSNGLFKVDNQSFRPVQFMFMDQEHITEKKKVSNTARIAQSI